MKNNIKINVLVNKVFIIIVQPNVSAILSPSSVVQYLRTRVNVWLVFLYSNRSTPTGWLQQKRAGVGPVFLYSNRSTPTGWLQQKRAGVGPVFPCSNRSTPTGWLQQKRAGVGPVFPCSNRSTPTGWLQQMRAGAGPVFPCSNRSTPTGWLQQKRAGVGTVFPCSNRSTPTGWLQQKRAGVGPVFPCSNRIQYPLSQNGALRLPDMTTTQHTSACAMTYVMAPIVTLNNSNGCHGDGHCVCVCVSHTHRERLSFSRCILICSSFVLFELILMCFKIHNLGVILIECLNVSRVSILLVTQRFVNVVCHFVRHSITYNIYCLAKFIHYADLVLLDGCVVWCPLDPHRNISLSHPPRFCRTGRPPKRLALTVLPRRCHD